MKKTQNIRLAVYSAAHLIVDFSCYVILFGYFSPQASEARLAEGFLMYNTVAFPLQMLFGRYFDRRLSHVPALCGCVLVIAGLLLHQQPLAAAAVCAFGNALFHVGGGIDSLRYSSGRFARPGLFVAFGALGVSFGTWAGLGGISVWPVILLVLVCGLWILVCCREEESEISYAQEGRREFQTVSGTAAPDSPCGLTPPCGKFAPQEESSIVKTAEAVIVLCLISVIIRSFAGYLIMLPWQSEGGWFFLASLCAFLGKASGGIAADRFGARETGTITLAASILLLWFGEEIPLLCGLGLIFFNMTMAVTAGTIYGKLPGRPGFAFGLTTLGLWLGYLPEAFGLLPAGRTLLLPAAILVSAVCLLLAAPGRNRGVG